VKKFEESFLFNILKQPLPPGFCLTKAACLKAMLVQKKMEPAEGMAPALFATSRVQLVFPDSRSNLLAYCSNFATW
jgi:hypothetical protein